MPHTAAGGVAIPVRGRMTGARAVLERLRRQPVGVAAGVVLLVVVLCALLAPVLSPYDPQAQDVGERLQGPSAQHLLGTDQFGRDLLSRILYGARPSLAVATMAVALAFAGGLAIGVAAGYFGGWIDRTLSRVMDVMLSFPVILLAILIVLMLGPGLTNLVLAVGVSQIPVFGRQARALTLSTRSRAFVQASIGAGAGNAHILRHAILPNILTLMVVQAASVLGFAILSAAALSYLGFGVQPPTAEWGSMVANLQPYIFQVPLLSLFPGVAIALAVMSLNLLSDALIAAVDPVMRSR